MSINFRIKQVFKILNRIFRPSSMLEPVLSSPGRKPNCLVTIDKALKTNCFVLSLGNAFSSGNASLCYKHCDVSDVAQPGNPQARQNVKL